MSDDSKVSDFLSQLDCDPDSGTDDGNKPPNAGRSVQIRVSG